MQIRREKKLCYTCDEKFTSSHRCPNKQYLLLQMDEDETLEHQPTPEEMVDNIIQDPHLSYNALKGSMGLGTMKFQGTINGMVIQILLDSGSSDNFLQHRIANYLKLPVEEAPSFQVLVGNGNSLEAEGMVKQLEVLVQGQLLKIPVYLLPISGADLVLGAAWLATLGPHISDYSKLTLKFYKDKQFVTLHGDKYQFNHLRRMHNTHAIAEVFTLQCQQKEVFLDSCLELPDQMPIELVQLLHNYSTIFATPTTLPPSRSHNHVIPLMKDAKPVKVRPYRYPQVKNSRYKRWFKRCLLQALLHPALAHSLPRLFWLRRKMVHGSFVQIIGL